MDNRIEKTGIFETIIGILIDLIPVLCIVLIITWAGRAYAEGYGIFVQKPLDSPGEAHSEMVEIPEESAGSALAVGRILEDQNLISSRFAFAVKARLSGYNGAILPGTYILSSDMTMEQMLEKLSVEPGIESGGQDQGAADPSAADRDQTSGGKENKDVWGQ